MYQMDIQFLQDNAIIIALVALWDLFWKGLALWRAARRGSKIWFVVLLVVNSAGILPIIYLMITSGLTFDNNKAVDADKA